MLLSAQVFPYSQLVGAGKMLDSFKRHLFYDAILTFKCLRGPLAPKYLSSRFNTRASVHGGNTRNKNKLDIPAFNTAAGQRSFIYRAVKCWNTLPEEIIKCESLHSFKSKAESFLYSF